MGSQNENKEGKTVGQLNYEWSSKDHEAVETKELTDAILTDYEDNIQQAVKAGISELGTDTDFFIVVLSKKEGVLRNAIRNYFLYRRSCPTPTCEQTVYIYHADSGVVDLLWTIPTQQACSYLYDNRLSIDKSEWELLNYVLLFREGSLDNLARRLNNEIRDQGIADFKINSRS